MSGISGLEGCPWHIENLRKKDERRHSHNCIYYSNYKCTSLKSRYYSLRCGGATHCSNYKEISQEDKIKKSINKKDDEPYWY